MMKAAVITLALLSASFALLPQASALSCVSTDPDEAVECQTDRTWIVCPDGNARTLGRVLDDAQGGSAECVTG